MLEIVILGFLSYAPLSGYDLKQSIESSTKYFWDAKQSQIYRTLKQLEAEGKVVSTLHEQADRPDKRVYEITPAGREMVTLWLDQPMTSVTYKKDPLLLKTFFASLGSKESLLTQLRLQRDLMHLDYQHLHVHVKEHLVVQKAALPPAPLYLNTYLLWEQTRQYGERYFDMYIQWLDECIGTIENEMIDNGEETHGS